MASANPNAANSALLGAVGGARPVSPTHSFGTVGPGESWESESNDAANSAVIQNAFMGSNSHAISMGNLYPDLEGIQLSCPGAGINPATAPLSHTWFPDLQGPGTADWEPLENTGETAMPQNEGRLPPPTPTLDALSWRVPPRTTGITAERMYKLKVHSATIQQFEPQGGRPFVVNPANRYLSNRAGLALAIEIGAGVEYAAWCHQIVRTRPNEILGDGEVVVCGPYLLSQRGYQGIVNVAMENVIAGTQPEAQKPILNRYYDNLFKQAYNLKIDYLVMSLFGVGTWNYDKLTSIWCFLDSFQRLPNDNLEIALLIPDVTLANTVRRAQMEAWPRDRRHGWGDAFEIPPPHHVAQELSLALQDMNLRQNQTWPRSSEEHRTEATGGNAPNTTRNMRVTWPPAGLGGQNQGPGGDSSETFPPSPAQPIFETPSHLPVPSTPHHQHPADRSGGQSREERGPAPRLLPAHSSQDPVGTPRVLPAPVPLYPGGAGPNSHSQTQMGSREMPLLYERHIPHDPSRVLAPIRNPGPPTGPQRPLATSTPSHRMATQQPDVSPVPAPTHFLEVSNQSAPQGSLSEGPRTTTSGAQDAPLNIVVSDQFVEQDPSGVKWSLLTFTNPSLTKSARWETHIIRKGGAPYRELRKAIMDTRSQIGLCPGKPLMTPCPNIFPAVTKMVHLALRKNTLEGTVLPESEQRKVFRDISALMEDRSLFEGYGFPDQPYRMIINMKWGRFKVQGLKKTWMWAAIAAALSSINDPDHMVIHLMVDPEDVRAMEKAVRQSQEHNEDRDEDSRPHSSPGQISWRESISSGSRQRDPSPGAQHGSLSSRQGTRHQDLPERGRSTIKKRVGIQFNSWESPGHSSTPRSILKQASSQHTEEEESEESDSDWEQEYEGRGPPLGACTTGATNTSSRASSSSQSRSRSHSRERRTYPRGEPPRAKNKRAKPVKLRPLRAEPPLKGSRFCTSSGLEWSSGISDISDDSEGELEGDESGIMLQGYPAKWEDARALARSPSAERVLSQPGLTGPYKDAYLHAGYDLMREQIIRRDTAMARAARASSPGQSIVRRGRTPSSYQARQEAELPSILDIVPVRSSTPYSAYSSLSYPNGGLVHATGYPSGLESHAHALLSKAQLIKQLAPEKTSGESQAHYLRRTAKIFEGSELYHDPDAARVLGHVKGLEVPAGASLQSLVALDVRTPGIDPGEKLVDELAPKVTEGKLTLAVAAEKLTYAVPVGKSTLLLEKLFSKIPAGFNLAVGCAQWTQNELRTECIKYDQIRQLTLLKRGQGSQKESGPPKQSKPKEKPAKDSRKKSQPKPKKGAKDSKNEKRGVSPDEVPKEDPPKNTRKQSGKKVPQGPKFLPAEEWNALPPEEKDKMRAQREAARAAKAAQAE